MVQQWFQGTAHAQALGSSIWRSAYVYQLADFPGILEEEPIPHQQAFPKSLLLNINFDYVVRLEQYQIYDSEYSECGYYFV